ncbi:B12-binding domain-containing radical SAM protein [Prosthecochloris sp. SCSIO W1102]|uniref:B12-binding domain-containing radical SAM protein n=1 Tax=Prosthecochloris sp. SCSIO W1102 TaxID=2992243 RepID=UPI00223CC292|nr:radical SAM protein [Prosthecochloris sp. SCSIO W1102]UZJ39750.1 B12-binding domain-containing radical SAM protein [Prosthecochloris sp. SCSIO W1102]
MSKLSVLLVFVPADSGVDGPSLLGESEHSGFLRGIKDSVLKNVIKRAQFAIPPLSLMILSSVDEPGIEQHICDLRFETFPLDRKWDLIGISVQTGAVKPAFELSALLREKGFNVVLGGPYVTLFPERCYVHGDVLVIGEADEIWRTVLKDLRNGTLRKEYRVDEQPDLSCGHKVKKDALDLHHYFTTNVVQTTRGCPYSCDFCNVHVMNGHKIRHRDIGEVVREVEGFLEKDKRIFFFLDDTVNADEEYAENLFRELIPFNISWVGQATTKLGENSRLLDVFSRSGCGALLVGIESLAEESNRAHHKFHNPADRQAACIRNIREAGICVYGSFIYGLDEDTLEQPDAIVEFLDKTGIDVPGINLLRPIPGTEVFERLADEQRLLHDRNDHDAFRFSWGQEMLYRPKKIPIETFIPSYTALTKRVFTVQRAFQRAVNAPTLKSAVLMFNLFYVHMYNLSRKDLNRQKEELEIGNGE